MKQSNMSFDELLSRLTEIGMTVTLYAGSLDDLELEYVQVDYDYSRTYLYSGAFLTYLKNGYALIPFDHDEDGHPYLQLEEMKMVNEEDISFLERSLSWYNRVSAELSEVLKKQRIRKIFATRK